MSDEHEHSPPPTADAAGHDARWGAAACPEQAITVIEVPAGRVC
jgi:hypothetical protein